MGVGWSVKKYEMGKKGDMEKIQKVMETRSEEHTSELQSPA